jgi:hypothetical protein
MDTRTQSEIANRVHQLRYPVRPIMKLCIPVEHPIL